MVAYDPFMDEKKPASSQLHSSCLNCQRRPTPDGLSIGSYEEGWDDHEGPCWDNPLDAQSVAHQAGLWHEDTPSSRIRPLQCTSQILQKGEEASRRSQSPEKDSMGVTCPPDIEEIDLYMPSVEHRWFNMYSISPESAKELNTIKLQDESYDGDRAKVALPKTTRRAKGCGYRCKLHEVRLSGLVKASDTLHEMVQVQQGAF